MITVPLYYTLAKYLLEFEDLRETSIMEKMKHLHHNVFCRFGFEPAFNIDLHEERIHEVVCVLRQWVHIGVLNVSDSSEQNYEVVFAVRNKDYLSSVIKTYEESEPLLLTLSFEN